MSKKPARVKRPTYTHWKCDKCRATLTTLVPASGVFHPCRGKSEPMKPDMEKGKSDT